MKPTLSILGMYNYDNSIFDGLRVPIGMEKNVLIANIFRECAELEVLFANPTTMRDMIKWWTDSEYDKWQKLFETENFEYNPVENYDRYEETITVGNSTNKTTENGNTENENTGSITHDINTSGNDVLSGTVELDGSVTESGTVGIDSTVNTDTTVTNNVSGSGSNNGTTTDYKVAFNSGTETETNKSTVSNSATNTETSTNVTDGSVDTDSTTTTNNTTTTDNTTKTNETKTNTVHTVDSENDTSKNTGTYGTESNSTGSNDNKITSHIHGNIGVTSAMDLIRQQREIVKFCTYDYIVSEFKWNFCLCVY